MNSSVYLSYCVKPLVEKAVLEMHTHRMISHFQSEPWRLEIWLPRSFQSDALKGSVVRAVTRVQRWTSLTVTSELCPPPFPVVHPRIIQQLFGEKSRRSSSAHVKAHGHKPETLTSSAELALILTHLTRFH